MTGALQHEKQTVKDFIRALFLCSAEWRLDTRTMKDVRDKDNNTV